MCKMSELKPNTVEWHKHKRKMKKIRLFTVGMILVVLSSLMIYVYSYLKKDSYISYTEKANVDYKVNLKENDFYEKTFLEENANIIASLIKNIEANFKYDLEFEKDNAYIYDYRITARTEVKEDKKVNIIYDKEEEIISKPIQEVKNNRLTIEEKIDVDYNKYNEIIRRFVNVYDLDNTSCMLELNMYLNVYNKYDTARVNKEEKVMTLYIPLTTKTVDISLSANTLNNEGKVLERKSEYGDIAILKIMGMVLGLLGIMTLIAFVKYMSDSRSAEKMYDQALKNLLFSYKQYIQKITTDIEKEKYKEIEVESFNEILEMKETLQAPILMYTEENVRRTKFMIINNEMLFVYTLGSQEIRNKLIEESNKKKNKNEKK